MAENKERVNGPELELNLAGGLLATITEGDLTALISRAEKAGFPNFCALPFRGLQKEGSVEKLADSGVSVVHIEDAWNPLTRKAYDHFLPALVAGTYGTFSRRLLRTSSNIPLIEDALFPSQETSSRIVEELMTAFPEAKFISHQASLGRVPKNRFLLEIHPGLEITREEIADWSQELGVGLVFDPSHLLQGTATVSRPGQPTQPGNFWEREFNYFAQTGKLEVVDIQPSSKQAGSYRQIQERALRELARAAKEINSVRYLRVETRLPLGEQLPWLSRKRSFPVLSQIAQTLNNA